MPIPKIEASHKHCTFAVIEGHPDYTAGASVVACKSKVSVVSDGMSPFVRFCHDGAAIFCVGRKVDVDDLIDTQDVATILGLAHRNTVSEYQPRYVEMPRPVVDRRRGRPKLWLRPEVERWAAHHRDRAAGRGRPRLIDQQR